MEASAGQKTKIKICGLTRPEEAAYCDRNSADYAGFVLFFEKSRRNISVERAKEIMSELPQKIRRVAVTVSPTKAQLETIADAGFSLVQVHGEAVERLLHASPLPVWRAVTEKEPLSWESAAYAGLLFDAVSPGSGRTFDWNRLKDSLLREGFYEKKSPQRPQIILAGGLTADNVAEAIRLLNPDVVDVSTGVEYDGAEFRGKSPEKIEAFVRAVRQAEK